jgi:AcrR family transcriptional regulator
LNEWLVDMTWMKMRSAVGGLPRANNGSGSHVGKREQQKVVHRQAILEAAERVLGADLRECVAVDRIAARAGLAKGTVYNYFCDKAALVEAVTQSVEARAAERIDQAVGNLSTAGARVAAAIGAMFETAARYPEQAVILERRIGAAGGQESLIGRVLLKELHQGEVDCIAESSAQRAALTLILSAICSGMREVTCPHARWGADETQALIARCLVALGIGEERAALEAHTALSRGIA